MHCGLLRNYLDYICKCLIIYVVNHNDTVTIGIYFWTGFSSFLVATNVFSGKAYPDPSLVNFMIYYSLNRGLDGYNGYGISQLLYRQSELFIFWSFQQILHHRGWTGQIYAQNWVSLSSWAWLGVMYCFVQSSVKLIKSS